MIKKHLTIQNALKCTLIVLMLLMHHLATAGSGALFDVQATGTPANLSITLCLNGKGPLSCQNYTVSALTLTISTTIPNHIYSAAGIKINTPGYSLIGCTPISNGYCLFTTSQTTPAQITIRNSSASAILTPSIGSLALSVNCPTLSGGCVHANAALTGVPRQITITNTGTDTATNVSMINAGLPSGTTTSSTCGNTLVPNASCVITITPGTSESSNCSSGIAPTSATATVRADNAQDTQVSVVVLSYGCIYQGGYIYAIKDTTPITTSIGGKVTALVDQVTATPGIIWSADSSGAYDNGVSIWGIDDASLVNNPSPNASSFSPATKYPGQLNCNGATDGSCDTNNVFVYYSAIAISQPPLTDYAVGLCKLFINGYADWYLPSICEMGPNVLNQICPTSPAIENITDNLSLLWDSSCVGTKCLLGDYWSSTELQGNPEDLAWTECFDPLSNSNDGCPLGKDTPSGVRCSRIF